MSPRHDDLRRDATKARDDLVSTIGEIGSAVAEIRSDALVKAKKAAPAVGGGLLLLILLRWFLLGRHARRR